VSLTAAHWRHGRRFLIAEAVVMALIGAVGLVWILVSPGHRMLHPFGVALTPTLSAALLALAIIAWVASHRRRIALAYCALLAISSMALVIIAAVAAVHSAPGPLGLTAPMILFWAAVFTYNFMVAVWMVPDRIEGPAWVRRSGPGRAGRAGFR
jgi:hypothetical protein